MLKNFFFLFLGPYLKEANKPPDSWFDLKVNTHVYVTGLPEDVTADEVSDVHSLSLPLHLDWFVLCYHPQTKSDVGMI